MRDFLRKLSILIRNIFTKKVLIYIIIFLLMIILNINSVKAFSPSPPINYIGFTNTEKTLLQSFFSSINQPNINGNSYNYILIHRSAESGYAFDILMYTNYMGNVYLSATNTITFQNYNANNSKYEYYLYRLKSDGTKWGPALPSGNAFKNVNIVDSSCIGTNRNIYTDSTASTILYPDIDHMTTPIQIQNSSDISSWNFQTMNIIGDDLYADTSRRAVYYTLRSVVNNNFSSDLSVYKYGIKQEETNNYFTSLMIPRTQILTDYQIKPNDSIHFYLIQRIVNTETEEELTESYDLGTYTLGITQTEADNINSQANMTQNQQQLDELENINTNVQQTTEAVDQNTEAIEQLENTIKDDTVTSTASDLPSVDVQDITQNGIDSIFQSIYNAFCTGQAQDIIFPIPFTNKNITLSPYYIRDMLNNNGASWIYTLIQAFWGYVIGRYIVKDVSRKITKIKGGNIENLENENIKEEML